MLLNNTGLNSNLLLTIYTIQKNVFSGTEGGPLLHVLLKGYFYSVAFNISMGKIRILNNVLLKLPL